MSNYEIGGKTADDTGYLRKIRNWMSENKLTAVGIGWVSTMGISMAYQWSRAIPLQLKIIHSRIYAQAFTVAAICTAGLIQSFDDDKKKS